MSLFKIKTNKRKWCDISFEEKPKKKSYTQVRIDDNIIYGLKEFIRKNGLNISYTKIVNTVTKKFLEENGITIKE